MNVHKKLNELRLDFLSIPHQKSGKNAFAGYSYFELQDFLPEVLQLCKKHGLSGTFRVLDGTAWLVISNVEAPEECINFTAPFGSCNLKGCHEAQNIGASITYMRRYLWSMALELVENDAIDCVEPIKPKAEPKAEKTYKKAPAIDVENVKKAMQKAGNVETLDKYMRAVNERGTPEQIAEVTKFYEQYKEIITDFKNKLGTPE